MPHPIKTVAPAVFCLLAAALLLGYAPAATAGAMQGLAACGKIILPAVFPFLAVSVFLAGAPGGAGIAALFGGVMRNCYRLPGAAAPALLMGCIGGYPAGAKTLTELQKHSRGDVALRLLHPEQGAAVLQRSGLTVRQEQQDLLLPPMQDARLAELVQALSAAGAGVVGVTVRSRTLEEIFLNLTESGVNAQ